METATVELNPSKTAHRINPNLYGLFLEHLGGCIYDGLWVGPDSHIENVDGLRLDTLRALGELEIPVVRWPGGLWADNYHWQDGVGPRRRRPVRQNLGWDTLEDNQFGTHEFMQFCRWIKTDPYLCVNTGCGTVEEARAWAEYCNCDKDTTLARQRASNGSAGPFRVKYWGLGNEPPCPQDGMMTLGHYMDLCRNFAPYVKHWAAQAPGVGDEDWANIKTILSLVPWWMEEFEKMFAKEAWTMNYFDLLALHSYAGPKAPADAPAEQIYRGFLVNLLTMDRQLQEYTQCAKALSTERHSVDIAVDEWGIWRREATQRNGLAQEAAMMDALYAAAAFHVMHRYEKVYMANLAQAMNVLHALILTSEEKFVLTPTYHVFEMFRPHKDAKVVEAAVTCDRTIDGTGGEKMAALSVSATTANGDGDVFVSLVNLDPARELSVKIALAGGKSAEATEARRLSAEALETANTFERPDLVRPEVLDARRLALGEGLVLPAASITTIALGR